MYSIVLLFASPVAQCVTRNASENQIVSNIWQAPIYLSFLSETLSIIAVDAPEDHVVSAMRYDVDDTTRYLRS